MARATANAGGWSGRDTIFVIVLMAFGIFAAAVGAAMGGAPAPEHDTDRPAARESCDTAITGGIGSPFPTGCR